MDNQLGRFILKSRTEINLSRWKLFRESGVSVSYIKSLELGESKRPHPDILEKLAAPLGVSYETLMDVAGYKNPKRNSDQNSEYIQNEFLTKAIQDKEMLEFLKEFYELPFEKQVAFVKSIRGLLYGMK